MWVYITLAVRLLWVLWPVESQTVSEQVRHGLVTIRARSLFGSNMTGHCTSIVYGSICNGTSVQNDGVVPVLNGVTGDSTSTWAEQLFTMERPLSSPMSRIVMSFELEDTNHDRIELSVFNCPLFRINTPQINVYFDSSFRPLREMDRSFGTSNINVSLSNTSCDYLLKFCVKYANVESSRFVNLEFPFVEGANNSRVFVGEVTFVNGGDAPCGPPELIRVGLSDVTDSDSTTHSLSTSTFTSTGVVSDSQSIVPTVVGGLCGAFLLSVVLLLIIVVVAFYFYRQKKLRHPEKDCGDEAHAYDYINVDLPKLESNTAYGIVLRDRGQVNVVDSGDNDPASLQQHVVRTTANESYNNPATIDPSCDVELKQNDAYSLEGPVTTAVNTESCEFDPSSAIEAKDNECYGIV